MLRMVEKIKKNTKKQKEKGKDQKRQNKLNSLKNEFEGGKIKSFDQLFAIFSPSPFAKELNIPFYTFKNKIADPGEFTINELKIFAGLINTSIDIIIKFILVQIETKKSEEIK